MVQNEDVMPVAMAPAMAIDMVSRKARCRPSQRPPFQLFETCPVNPKSRVGKNPPILIK
jgi:hypothetical protein